jgi:hypothetical protein
MSCKITLFWYSTSHLASLKITLQTTLHRTRMPMGEAMDNPGTIYPLRIIGSPGITMSHTCVERTTSLFGRLIKSGSVAGQMLLMGVPAIINMEVAPVLAMDCVLANTIALGRPRQSADAILCSLVLFDVMTVAPLSLLLSVMVEAVDHLCLLHISILDIYKVF